MHVRLAPAGGGRGLTARVSHLLPILAGLIACGLAGACDRTARDLTFEWTLTPMPPVADRPATLALRILDRARRPLSGARLRIEAHMSHPGMAPVLASVTDMGEGRYSASLRLTMGGDWILLVSGSLPDGTALQHRIDVPGVRSKG